MANRLSQFTNWLVAMIAPILLDKSAFGAYFLFGALALGTVIVLALYMPETRGRSLENIQEAFKVTGFSAGLVARGHRRIRHGPQDAVELQEFEGTASAVVSHRLRVDL